MKRSQCLENGSRFVCPVRNRSVARRRRGATLIDVAMGSWLLAVVLIPSVKLLRHNERLHRTAQLHDVMLSEADRLAQQTTIDLHRRSAGDLIWTRDQAGTPTAITVVNTPPLLGKVDFTRDRTLPLTVDALQMTVTVWRDEDGDRRVDADEPREQLLSQIAPR